ncbi:spermidine/putrescine ABC transporter substrate-binding protein [Desulfuromonas versatilis]|uniref:Spermidine/putrescine ABC transporter substrate-binding protein n=1 Tax=Desulfuromonas versatilis TaxID=2802975 RepID=A0ABN6DU96_9BACT|nr:spermidine/putrescine ABC transporter substrate-binding protein [Desulfuromonas versatilis]BCR03307.1 spermidine/putrescine ABC transporter substrate-binding protein [Desulfuromonas versatilis]
MGKWLNRALRILLLAVYLVVAGKSAALAQKQEPVVDELVLLNWSDYMDPELLEEFQASTGAKVTQVYFETDEMRDDMLLGTNGAGYDLVVANGPGLTNYIRRGWLAPLTLREVPNLRHIETRWLEAFPEARGHAVPLFWGTTGIAYRKDLVSAPVTSWRQLFQPEEALRGKIVMIKSSADTIGMALKCLGYSANSTDPAQLAEVERLLKGQKPFVQTYSYVSLTEESSLVSGTTWMAMMYSGDALMLKDIDEQIAYVVPEEGGNLWVDYLGVMASSSKKELAARFINFLHEPKNMARLAQYVHYAPPNRAAQSLLPKEFLDDPVVYPPQETIGKSEFYQQLPPRTVKERNRIFSEILR